MNALLLTKTDLQVIAKTGLPLLTKADLQRRPAFVSGFPFEIKALDWTGSDRYGKDELFPIQQNFKIVWITRGRVRFRVDLRQFDVGANQVVCMRPGRFIGFENLGGGEGDAEGYILSFTESFLSMEDPEFDSDYQRSLSRMFADSMMIPVMNEIRADMNGIRERMEKEYENLFLYKDQILKRLLKIFLIYLSRHGVEMSEDLLNSRGVELSQEFISLLEKNFKKVRSINEYAKQLSVTANHLNVVVKKNTGHTAGHHVKQRLILEAKRLAVYSNLCMKEIADQLGFSDPAHFSKFFKNCSGANFSDFKKEHVRFPLYRG